ncbi:hypothetical protein K491DRAFT_686873 [Lophiostoma macrostomum CBS 122681]|uniref:Uncharacterized protein n=1 Tax=Lophiostoma macrostomum CBS 122681 TaxID=1314788 RepID=A0A6A6TPA2_9PLEO|nr:hypothetical protein K491DRAFT_686873 [Lophiostoma macrostomum CBS 122681]
MPRASHPAVTSNVDATVYRDAGSRPIKSLGWRAINPSPLVSIGYTDCNYQNGTLAVPSTKFST